VSWQRVKGHDAVVQAFAQVVRRGRLAHAYLFVGPPGVGKRLFANEFAKALLCEQRTPEKFDACDQCPSCIQVDAETHPDLFAVSRPEESLEVPIELIRELCASFSLKSARGRGKVAILDDADDLNEAAANCFLKTLEEPPAGSVLLLIGTTPERQLSTLVSRCQVVRFHPLSEVLVADLLKKQEITDQALLHRLVRLSEGSPGQALELADPALWEFRRKLFDGLFGPKSDGVALAQEWMHFVEEAGKESAPQRQRAARVLRLLVEFLRDAVSVRVGGKPRLDDPEDVRVVRALAGRVEPERLLELLERSLEADMQIDRRVQLVLILEALVDALGQLQAR
jgi:DNA polymerase-3 subunit delta'